ncbi:MAG: FAD-dependent oxidoreductase, partial [Clostridia bacterium]
EAFKTEYECDVVIAGAGIGGLAAAVSAAEKGATVILVEASQHVGGTSRFAAGAFGPRFGADWEAAYAKAPMSDPVLGKLVCEKWPEYVEWITGLGMTTEELAP